MRNRMLAGLLVFAVALVVAGEASAQSGGVEVFLGAGHVDFDAAKAVGDGAGDAVLGEGKLGMWGIHGDITLYFGSNVGIVLDGTFPRGDLAFTLAGAAGTVEVNQAMYLVGPRLRFGSGSVSPSIQGLVGWVSGSLGKTSIEGLDQSFIAALDDSSFAAAGDFNLDIGIGASFALRGQVGIVLHSLGSQSQTNPRYSFGIVGRF